MVFRVYVPIEVEKPDQELSSPTRLEIQVIYDHGRWRAQCADPPVSTLVFESMQEALVAAVKEIKRDWVTEAVEN